MIDRRWNLVLINYFYYIFSCIWLNRLKLKIADSDNYYWFS